MRARIGERAAAAASPPEYEQEEEEEEEFVYLSHGCGRASLRPIGDCKSGVVILGPDARETRCVYIHIQYILHTRTIPETYFSFNSDCLTLFLGFRLTY